MKLLALLSGTEMNNSRSSWLLTRIENMNGIHPRGVGRKYDIIWKRNSSKRDTASGDIDVFSSRQCYHPTRSEGLKANRPSQIDDITIQVSPSRTISFNWLTGEIYNSSVLGTQMRTHWAWEPIAHIESNQKVSCIRIMRHEYGNMIWMNRKMDKIW